MKELNECIVAAKRLHEALDKLFDVREEGGQPPDSEMLELKAAVFEIATHEALAD